MKTAVAGVLWLVFGVVFSAPVWAASADCVAIDVSVDDAHHAIDVSFRPPASVKRIALQPLAPYSRKALWQSPDGSAQIEDEAIVANPGHRVLHVRMDASRTPERQDRAYAPFLRFADGTVAIDTQQFLPPKDSTQKLCQRYVPAHGQQVIGFSEASTQPLDLRDTSPLGYVAFGTPYVERHGDLLLAIDKGTPSTIRERVASDVPRLMDFYVQHLGPAKTPTLFLFMQPDEQGVRSFHGDHLPSSITLGLMGQGWDSLEEADWQRLTGFVAHELFHTWNSAPALGSPEGEALLAKEGGAELARVMATASLSNQTSAQWLPRVGSMYNVCLFDIHRAQSVASALEKRAPGGLPYNCGAPLMLALALAANPQDPVAGYFDLWAKLTEQRRGKSLPDFAWTDLIPPGTDAALRDELVHAIQAPDAYADSMQAAFHQLGVRVEPASKLDAENSQRYAGALMSHLMRVDCDGNVSFWTQPDGFLIDKSLSTCHVLQAGNTVDALLGQPFATADMLALSKQVADRCAHGSPVKVGYKGAVPPDGNVPCTQPLPVLPKPLVFTGLDGIPSTAEASSRSSPTIGP
nr:hypothetical protein [Dyella sp. ASV24]